jgi:NAD(P)-dependent dehydrogenase (short-subunit alcohol dehydrogenase family)
LELKTSPRRSAWSESEGRKILADHVDVRDLAAQQRVVSKAIEQFGRLHIVVANAGVLNWGRLWEISVQQWQDTIDTDLAALSNTIKSAVPPMIAAGNGGSIITISSAAGIKAVPGCGHYCASKFGVVKLTNSLDRRTWRVRHPGQLGTPLRHRHPDGQRRVDGIVVGGLRVVLVAFLFSLRGAHQSCQRVADSLVALRLAVDRLVSGESVDDVHS